MKKILNKILNRKSSEEKRRLNFFEDFEIDSHYTTVFNPELVKKWKDYYNNNYNFIPEKMQRLKNNLDAESIEFMESLFDRYINLAPAPKYLDSFVVKNNMMIFSKTEKELFHKHGEKFIVGLEYVPEIYSKIKDKIVIDAGAYDGDSASEIVKFGPSRVYSFEPNYTNYEKLTKTISDNNLSSIVKPINFALGDVEGTQKLYGIDNGASFVSNLEDDIFQEVKITTIDNFAEQNGIEPALIKIDIEDFEIQAIKGAEKVIQKLKPILLISIYHSAEEFFELKPQLEKLNPDYRFMIRKQQFNSAIYDFILIAY